MSAEDRRRRAPSTAETPHSKVKRRKMEKYTLIPIAYVRSSLRSCDEAPHQGRDSSVEAVIEIEPAFREALDGVAGHDRLQLICWLHLAERNILKIHPRHDPSNPMKGVFATRSPSRPNPLACYTVELIEWGSSFLRVRGIDAIDGTPVVDIKPHVHRLDD
jgi:tRNA-Thr(GGU) m(6)t(6)A37 methyltransferase TsaA